VTTSIILLTTAVRTDLLWWSGAMAATVASTEMSLLTFTSAMTKPLMKAIVIAMQPRW
jgi:hypothetical protein